MQSKSGWWRVKVEDKATGIRGEHYVQTWLPSTAREEEQSKGYIVLDVQPW